MPGTTPTQRVHPGVQRLEAGKRRVYGFALGFGVIIVVLSWLMRHPGDAFIAYLYPIFALVLAAMLPLLWWPRMPLRLLEGLMLGTLAAMVLARLAWHFHFSAPIDEQLLVLVGGHYWAVGALIVASFVVLDHKRGLLAGTVIVLVSALIAVAGVAGEWRVGEVSQESTFYLLRVHLFLGLLLVLTSAATAMRDELQRALLRADILDEWANTDMPTGLANRRAADRFLNQEVAAARRYRRPLSVLSLDIDHFKKVNDAYGHGTGDAVIEGVARRLEASVREPDLVARWGGEEFLIVAPEIPLDDAKRMAERCRRAIEEQPVAGVEVTVTIGVAELQPGEGIDAMLSRADAMLYEGKRTGRNRVVGTAAGAVASPSS
ncbi:diguanylate cyclase [Arhodomonas sp. SL1]|uniref:GGDEF domain-containing protein n=1 Tax=Arhodomonas sp. SL1 TaxID=3425691 RepID=UPI003F884705